MKKIVLSFCGALLIAGFQNIGNAALHIELTQGISSAIPIAVVPFKGQSNDINDTKNLAGTIQSDLKNSGQFKVLDSSSFKQLPGSPNEVNLTDWKNTNANALVVGNVTSAGGGQLKVDFSLVDTVKGSDQNHGTVLVSDHFTIPASQARRLAHRISDAIYQKLTGKRGIFSTRIAYVLVEGEGPSKRFLLEVADADGYNPKPILVSSEPIMSPNWSPDGHKVAYVSFENKRAGIYISDIASGARQHISSYPGINGAPHFSPDGSQLALALSMNGIAPDIYLMNIGSHQLKQLTHDGSINTEPFFSPNRSSLAFTSNRAGGPQIYKLELGSGAVTRVSYEGNYNATPSFTPDGKSIVVLHGEGSNNYDAGLFDLDSGSFSLLTHTGGVSSPSVAPNGQMIIYADNSNGKGSLGIVSVDGKIRLQLPSPQGSVREPSWSPYLT
jgi:TolB protein